MSLILRLRVLVAMATGLFCLFGESKLEAQAWQTDEFFAEQQELAPFYGFRFWSLGLKSVARIRFSDDGTDRFHPLRNLIVLGSGYGDGGGRLKPWSKLGPIELGTLAHESFHAYLHNHMRRNPNLAHQMSWMNRRSEDLYRDEVRGVKAKIALEEAYASFVGMLVTSHWTLSRILRLQGVEEEKCESAKALAEKLWERSWTENVLGYYSRDGIGEYWADRLKELWASLRGTDSGIPVDGTYFVETPLTETDKNWIGRQLFEGRVSRAFHVSFAHELSNLPCVKASAELAAH